MTKMTRDEYCEWLKENKNKEEVEACSVVDAVLREHMRGISESDYDVFLEPRKTITYDDGDRKRRIEFDLVIYLVTKPHVVRKNVITIGVEFKEFALQKVIWQAVRRLPFVDYEYIATRNLSLPPLEATLGVFAGVGWIIWSEDAEKAFVVMRAASKYSSYRDDDWTLYAIVNLRINKMIDMEVENALRKRGIKLRTLFDFAEGEI